MKPPTINPPDRTASSTVYPKACDGLCQWEEQLQDRIDGDLDAAQCLNLDKHLADCPSCRARMSALQAIDAALSASLPSESLGTSFDRQVLERIAGMAAADLAATRARAEQEWREQKADFSRQWRARWRALALNVLAGAAVVIALATAFDLLPFVSQLIGQTELLMHQAAARPAVIFSAAGGLGVAALLLVRFLASVGR